MFPSIGAAVGQVIIRTDDVLRAQAVIVQASQRMTTALNSVQAPEMAKSLRQSELAAVGLVTSGLIAAQRVRQIEATFRVLTGSQERANQYMAELKQLSEETKQPFLEMVAGAQGLVPIVRRTNVEFAQTVELMQRLALLDPAQGPTGAAFAIREFLSGEVISLSRRFELGRSDLRNILNNAGGDMTKAIEGLSDYLDTIGVTKEALIELGREGVFAFEATRDEIIQTMATAFEPLLVNVILPLVGAVKDLAEGMREGNYAAVLLAGGLALVASRAAPLLNLTPARAVVGIAALEFGSRLGAGAAQQMADQYPSTRIAGYQVDPRLRSDSGVDPWDVIRERAGQLWGILSTVIADGVTIIRLAFEGLKVIVEWLGNLFEALGASIVLFQKDLQNAFGKLEEWVGNQIGDQHMARLGRQRQADATSGLEGRIVWDDSFMTSVYIPGFRDQVKEMWRQLGQAIDLPDGFEQQVRAEGTALKLFLINMGLSLFGQQTLGPIEQEGTNFVDKFKNLIDNVVNTFSAFTLSFADANREAREAREQAELEARRTQEDRAIADRREAEDFGRQRQRDILEFWGRTYPDFMERQFAREQDILDRISEVEDDANTDRIERLQELHKDEQRAEEDHQDALREIIEDGLLKLEDAIADRNGTAAQRAVRDMQDAIDDQEDEYAKARTRRRQDVNDAIRAAIEQSGIRRQQLLEELQMFRDNWVVQRDRLIAEFQERQALEDEDRAIRLQREQEDRQLRDRREAEDLQKRIQGIYNDAALNNAAFQNFIDLLTGARQTIVNWAASVKGAVQQMFNQVGSSPFSGTQFQAPQNVLIPSSVFLGSGSASYPSYSNPFSVPTRAAGGPARGWTWVGEYGPELVNFTSPGTVFSSGRSHAMSGGEPSFYVDMSGWTLVGPEADPEYIADRAAAKFLEKVRASKEIAPQRGI